MAVVSVAIAALIIVVGIHSRFIFSSLPLLALCAYFPFGWMLLDRLGVRRNYNRDREKIIDHTAIFTNESISTKSTTTDIRLTWNQLASVVTTPRGLLFLTPPQNVWFWLPQRLFDGNTHKDTILELATEHKILIRQMA
jgi:hypothetical protein